MSDPGPDPDGEVDTILTIPNAVTLVRLLALPVYLVVLLGMENRVAAALILGAMGATDWVDGYLARRLGQVSEFGRKFDPTVDRLLFVVGIGGILIDGSAPLWFCLAVLAREVLVGGAVAIATVAFGMQRFDVTFAGKTATFLLMFTFPAFLLGASDLASAGFFEFAAWALGIPGLVLSWYTAFAYIPNIRDGVRNGRAAAM